MNGNQTRGAARTSPSQHPGSEHHRYLGPPLVTLDDLAREEIELIRDFAGALPVTVIAEMVKMLAYSAWKNGAKLKPEYRLSWKSL